MGARTAHGQYWVRWERSAETTIAWSRPPRSARGRGLIGTSGPRVREPSPPFEHVSWREEVEHDANEDVTVLAVTVMGGEAEWAPHPVVPSHLAKIARVPAVGDLHPRLVGAAVVPIPVFLYAGTRLHYFVGPRRTPTSTRTRCSRV